MPLRTYLTHFGGQEATCSWGEALLSAPRLFQAREKSVFRELGLVAVIDPVSLKEAGSEVLASGEE